jgi:Brp/Blh family beta-carotene 15,15'-monooxygenase
MVLGVMRQSWVMWLVLMLCSCFVLKAEWAEWLALGLIIFAGIPHGAYDLRAADKVWRGLGHTRWLIGVGYVAVGVAMSLFCLGWPALGLILFLGLSLTHFAEGESFVIGRLGGWVTATAAIVLPIALHQEAARPYLTYFLSLALLQQIALPLMWAGAFAVCAVLLQIIRLVRQGRLVDGLEIGCCLVAWVLLSPLAGFAVWFIGRHSRHHLQRCREQFPSVGLGISREFLVVSAAAILLLAPLGLRFNLTVLEELFAASIVLIAGLTLPHMVVTHLLEGSAKGR